EMRRLFALDLSRRDRAIIYLMAFTAVRGIEVHRANYQDLETRGQDMILNIQGKGKAEIDDFVLIASPEAREAIRDYIAERGTESGPLFLTDRTYDGQRRRIGRRTLQHIIKKAFKEAGIVGKKKTMHSLRKTAITSA